MNAPEKCNELCAVLGKCIAGELNLAAEIIAANSKCAGRTSEDGKAVWTANEMVRTKCETPSVAVGESDTADLVVVGREPR